MFWLMIAGAAALSGVSPQLVFPTSVEIVHVVVSVTDEAGRPVPGLKAADFTVKEDGKRREVTTVAACADFAAGTGSECSVDLVLLLDTSRSMWAILDDARDAAVQFMKEVPAAHTRNIVAFDSRIRAHPVDQNDPAVILDKALGNEGGGGGTRLYDAIFLGIRRFSRDVARRPVLVAVTDGEDTSDMQPGGGRFGRFAPRSEPGEKRPHRSVKDTSSALQQAGVAFYAISFAKNLGAFWNRAEHGDRKSVV